MNFLLFDPSVLFFLSLTMEIFNFLSKLKVLDFFFLFFFRRYENKLQVYAELKLCTSVVHKKNKTSATQNLERNNLIELVIKLLSNSGSS